MFRLTRGFGAPFVDALIEATLCIFFKSSLVAQNYSEVCTVYVSTEAPTFQLFSQ